MHGSEHVHANENNKFFSLQHVKYSMWLNNSLYKHFRIHVEDGKSGHKGVDLVFEEIERKDRGKYTCSASVDGQELEKSFELSVFSKFGSVCVCLYFLPKNIIFFL